MASLLTKCKNQYVAWRGFHTERHLVVIESDDWGSIRMPSAEVYRKLQKAGDHPENDAFLRNDCLENVADLTALFAVLTSVKDKNGSPAVMTANFAMANPDFDKIDPINDAYFFEPFTDTYKRYYPDQDVFSCVQDGIKSSCFVPQLHCREHMNVNRWMNDLKQQKYDTVIAFQNHMIGTEASFSQENPFGYMDAFNSNFTSDAELSNVVHEAMELFENTFGKKSETFVASCFVWNDALEKALCEVGVRGIQSGCWQNLPVCTKEGNALRRKLRFTGQKNRIGQVYTVRNCTYEPAYQQTPMKSAKECLDQIMRAFHNRKPAIINSHRFNYIGSINRENARENLKGLLWLLQTIIDIIPDAEFISTAELLRIIDRRSYEKHC
jgi:hypothetical protein